MACPAYCSPRTARRPDREVRDTSVTDTLGGMSDTWMAAYAEKSENERSWTQPLPSDSLAVIDSIGLDTSAAVIDVGGGASYLVDNLTARGFSDVTLLDLSPAALEESRARNGGSVTYVAHDVTTWMPPRTYALWHDRAVFHFLVDDERQEAYLRTVLAGTAPGSHLVLATFAPDGPESCSGLPVRRWSADGLEARFGGHFDPVARSRSEHTTPWGSVQPFTFVHLVRRG